MSELERIRSEFFQLLDYNNDKYWISMEQAFEWLQLEYTEAKKSYYINNYLRCSNYSFVEANEGELGHFVVKKMGRRDVVYFTAEGFKMFCLISKSPLSKYIIKHYIECEKDYIRALQQSKSENDSERDAILLSAEKYKSKLIEAEKERDSLMLANSKIKIKAQRLLEMEQEIDRETYAMCGSPEYKAFLLLKKKFFIKVPLYMLDDGSDPDLYFEISREYPSILDIVNGDDEVRQFYIPGKKVTETNSRVFICDLYIMDKTHLRWLYGVLSEFEINGKTRHVYQTSYDTIISNINLYFSDKLFETLG
jgi:hypothetical protein